MTLFSRQQPMRPAQQNGLCRSSVPTRLTPVTEAWTTLHYNKISVGGSSMLGSGCETSPSIFKLQQSLTQHCCLHDSLQHHRVLLQPPFQLHDVEDRGVGEESPGPSAGGGTEFLRVNQNQFPLRMCPCMYSAFMNSHWKRLL